MSSVNEQESLTLSEIKRRAKEDVVEDQDDGHGRRFRTLNFTSEDFRTTEEPQLTSYYCSVCGFHNFVLEGDLKSLSIFENTSVLDITKTFHKLYMKETNSICIKRPEGIEIRLMLRCKGCDFTLAYRVKDGDSMTQYLYIFRNSLISDQSSAEAFFDTSVLPHSSLQQKSLHL